MRLLTVKPLNDASHSKCGTNLQFGTMSVVNTLN